MCLGLADASKACAPLDSDEKDTTIVRTPGGPQQSVTVNESALYSLILKSCKPEAKAFKKWVSCVVLPAVRKDYAKCRPLVGPHHWQSRK